MGTYVWVDGATFTGQYKDNKIQGQGTYLFSNGEKYVGMFENGQFHGNGTYYWTNGARWVAFIDLGKNQPQVKKSPFFKVRRRACVRSEDWLRQDDLPGWG
jgi:hypothetical protein